MTGKYSVIPLLSARKSTCLRIEMLETEGVILNAFLKHQNTTCTERNNRVFLQAFTVQRRGDVSPRSDQNRRCESGLTVCLLGPIFDAVTHRTGGPEQRYSIKSGYPQEGFCATNRAGPEAKCYLWKESIMRGT